jgi:hypothetical protein
MKKPAKAQVVQSMLMLVISAWFAPVLMGQAPRPQEDSAPPPLRTISREERAEISAAKDSKRRIKLTIELAELHLTTAENETTQQDYEKAAGAAGRYWALIEDAFAFLKTLKADTNKTRDLYKRVELTLRAHGPRLSTIRRSTPIEYAVWIKDIEELARKGRTEALNSFYGHTVFQDRQQKSFKKQEEKPKP